MKFTAIFPPALTLLAALSAGALSAGTLDAGAASATWEPDAVRNHESDDAFNAGGGTIDFGAAGRYVVTLPYGVLSLGEGGHIASNVVHHDGWLGGGWPKASANSVIAWQGAFAAIKPLEFTRNVGAMTIRGQLDPSASYKLLVYAQAHPGWTLLARTALGTPSHWSVNSSLLPRRGQRRGPHRRYPK